MSADQFAQRSAARLAAVQALYQMEVSGATSADIAADFQAGRLPRDEAGPVDSEPDPDLFRALVENAVARQTTIDRAIARRLATGWRLERIDSVARAILRAGAVELEQRRDIPTPVVIDEYVELAKSFFDGPEPGFINATLDACARDLRAEAEDVGGRI
ncbi:MAG TPA: transcription antitermination factor NusB [Caulobacterales bacterium]|nr:transcription antitermination factor NusB [Caulobacterales bacterium]